MPCSSRDSFDTLRDGAAPVGEIMRLRCAEAFERRERLRKSRDQRMRRRARCRCSPARGSVDAATKSRRSRAFELVAETRKIVRESSAPGCGRVPRSIASSSISMARLHARRRAAEPAQRMLEQGQQRRRLQTVRAPPRRPAAQRSRPMCPSADRRRNRRRRDSSGRARPSPGAPARGRASPAPRSCSVPASRMATAMRAPPSSGLAASITASLSMPPRSSRRPRARPAGRAIVRSPPPAASLRTPAPRARAAQGRQEFHVARAMPKRVSRACMRELRMDRRGGVMNPPLVSCRRRSIARSRRRGRYRDPAAPPRLAAEWRWHAAVLRSMASSRWSRPRSPGLHDGVSRAASASISRSRRATGSIPPFSEDIRPASRAIFKKLERELPVAVERLGHEPVERAPVDAARRHVVHQPREIVGKRQRRGRAADNQRRLRRLTGFQLLRPCIDKLRERQAARKPSSAGGISSGGEPRGSPAQKPVRPRRCRRARRCAAGSRRRYPVHRERYRAPCGRRGGSAGRAWPRQVVRARARLESLDQSAVDQRGDDGTQKRRGCGDVADAHEMPDSGSGYHGMGGRGCGDRLKGRRQMTPLARTALSASWTASGVPTCIQRPSSRSPNSRSCSPAWSNIVVSENSPVGAPANSVGDMMAAPA